MGWFDVSPWERLRRLHEEALGESVELGGAVRAAAAGEEVAVAAARAGGGRGRRARARIAIAGESPLLPRPAIQTLDWRPLVILVVTAVSLSLQEYWGDRRFFAKLFPPPPAFQLGSSNWELSSLAWWAGWRVFGYLILPALVIVATRSGRLRDFGLSFKGFWKHAWIYVVLYLLVLPAVIIVSGTESFQRTYPFYKLAKRSTLDLVAWELLYSAQFLSLEFFFRGFMLHGLKRAIGAHAIWVMIVPYCMIHFGKPMPETFAAIIAGLVLGVLSLRTRSIWCGVLIHISVALTMDLLALQYCPAVGSCRR